MPPLPPGSPISSCHQRVVEHPFVEPFAGVTERLLEGQAFAGPEAVERHGEELDANTCHGAGTFLTIRSPVTIVSVS